MITEKWLVKKQAGLMGGDQCIYKFPSGWGLSLINSPAVHCYSFAWEAAVLNPQGRLDYGTALTEDVEIFDTDDEANEFIEQAAREIGGVSEARTME